MRLKTNGPTVLARQMEEAKNRWKGGGPRGGRARRQREKAREQCGNNGGQGNGNQPDDDQAKKSREVRRRECLDMTTPEQRAQRSVYRQAMRDMRQQQQGGGR